MGASVMKCYLGFPTFHNSAAGEALEREGDIMSRAYRRGQSQMIRGFELLHDSVDAAIAGDREQMAHRGKRALARLHAATAAVAELATTLERSRKALAELLREGDDPLAHRDHYFSQVDAERLAREIYRGTGHIGDKGLWAEMVKALVDGGAVAGLRLLEKTAWRLQTALREQTVRSEQALREEPLEVARRLHSAGLAGAVLADLWGTFFRQAGYLSLLSEEATRVWEVGVEREVARTA